MSRPSKTSMLRLALSFFATVVVSLAQTARVPANQLLVSGNACGPTALLNAFRFGNPSWQRVAAAVPGDNDKQHITAIIRQRGIRPSAHIQGRNRWTPKGVNLADLCDMANEMTRSQFLPAIRQEVLFRTANESQPDLLKRVHSRLKTSLAKGLPPIVSVRRYVLRPAKGVPPQWLIIDAHFVTLTTVPAKLEKSARSFPVTYIDPWGGKICQGNISISDKGILTDDPAASPCLAADFPDVSAGKKFVRPGDTTVLTVAAALGRW
jgi:hypothetical protein